MNRISVGRTFKKASFIVPLIIAILFIGLAIVAMLTGGEEAVIIGGWRDR